MSRRDVVGTCWFPSFQAAVLYYRPYGDDIEETRRKRADGEIHIGEPPRFKGEVRRWIQDSRWHIEVLR